VYLRMVLAAAQTSSFAAEAPLETAAHSKAGAATLPPTVVTTVSLTLENAVLPPTSQPMANVAHQTARFAWTLASATAAPALDGAATRRITAELDARLASAIVLSPTLEMCLPTALAGRTERPARVARTETAVLPMATVARVMISAPLLAVSLNSETALLMKLVFLPMVIVARTASPAWEAITEIVALQKVTAERTTIAVQDVKLLSAPATLIPVLSLQTVAAEASMERPARAVPLGTVVPKVAGAAIRQSTVMLVVKPSSVLATAKPARSPPTVVAEASTVRFAEEVPMVTAVRPRAIVVVTITVMRAAKLPSVPAKIAPTTSPLMGAVARTEKLARAASSGTVALSMDGVEKDKISVAMDVSWLMAFAPASPPTQSVDPGTERLV
jgi:hypothetical protein